MDNATRNMKRRIKISSRFLQVDSYSPVGFCITEIPVCKLLQKSKGYRIVDDLKQYQENHKTLKDVNEIILQERHDTGA